MLNGNIFKVDLRYWLIGWLPIALRKPVLVHLLWRIFAPVWTIYKSFYRKRSEDNFYARYDSGKGNVERMLNILFDNEERDIVVLNYENTIARRPIYLNEALGENSAVVSSSSLVYNSYIEGEMVQKAFAILVPGRLRAQVENIRAKATMYVLPGMGFDIIVID